MALSAADHRPPRRKDHRKLWLWFPRCRPTERLSARRPLDFEREPPATVSIPGATKKPLVLPSRGRPAICQKLVAFPIWPGLKYEPRQIVPLRHTSAVVR